jgi:phytoene/squalene synthetase
VFVALRETRARFALDKAPFEALLAAFRQDQSRTRYETWDELLAYCQNSAAPVGRLLLRLAQVDGRSPSAKTQLAGDLPSAEEPLAVVWSDAICAGLQIANFCQDVRRDWQRGRLYLPRAAWRQQGCDESVLELGDALKIAPVVREGVELAARLLDSGRPLLSVGPAWLRSDVALFLGGGEAILQAIRDRRYDVWSARPVVSRWAKWRLLPAAFRAFLAARGATEFATNRE